VCRSIKRLRGPDGTATDDVWVGGLSGTLLHHDALLARLMDRKRFPTWDARVYRAVTSWADRSDLWDRWQAVLCEQELYQDAHGEDGARAFFDDHRGEMLSGASVLWPERESYLDLMLLRHQVGRFAFDTEKMNDPSERGGRVFEEHEIRYWDDEFEDYEALKKAHPKLRTLGAIDPALGRSGRAGDDTAIIILARDVETKIDYVVHADVRPMKPDAALERVVELQKIYGFRKFGVESVGFQQLLADMLRRLADERGRPFSVEQLKSTAPKVERIQSMQPAVAAGKIRFSRRHRTLMDQLLRYPHGRRDDGPDALEMARRAAEAPVFFSVPRAIGRDGSILV